MALVSVWSFEKFDAIRRQRGPSSLLTCISMLAPKELSQWIINTINTMNKE